MNIQEFEKTILDHPDQDLAAIAKVFTASADACWHVDRHVVEQQMPVITDMSPVLAACRGGLSLLRRWAAQREPISKTGLFISSPYLIIDGEWLQSGDPSIAPPPHVYLCMAKTQSAFAPVIHRDAQPVRATGDPALDAVLRGERTEIRKLSSNRDPALPSWLIELD